MTGSLELVDTAANPHLSGRYEPVYDEIDADEMEVEGSIPPELAGAYLRNGPNPRFTPLGSYTYPMEGDGMIHGVWLEGGRARYANRWVRTAGMAAEERAGRAIFGGLMTPAFVDPALLGPEPDPGWPIRLDPFIHIVRHAGRYLALEEGTPPYEVTADLATVGLHDFAGGLPSGMCAHPKVDPVTGEMVVFRYDVEEPFLTWAVIGPDGSVVRPATPVAGVERSFMIHDFAITEHFVVLVVAPAVLDIEAMVTGGAVLQWRPELGTRIAVIPRDGSAGPRWIETEAFWVWHIANAFEVDVPGSDTGGAAPGIVFDFPWWSGLGSLDPSSGPVRGAFARATIRPGHASVDLEHVGDLVSEFPRIDDRRTGRRYRYLTVGRNSGRHDVVAGEHDELVRLDMERGISEGFDCGAAIGEAVFAPRPGGTDELDGYYVAFTSSLGPDRTSHLCIWDAAEFPSVPRARIQMPRRVPHGLHGNWFPGF